MKIIISLSLLLYVICVVESEILNYFIKDEAHIGEHRAYEDENSGYAPFYIVCVVNSLGATVDTCLPGTPVFFERDGIVAIVSSVSTAYYGCMNDTYDGKGIQKKLIMKRAKRVHFTDFDGQRGQYRAYVNIYKFKCSTPVSPIIWENSYQKNRSHYSIGFDIEAYGKMSLAEVYYDYQNYIPIWTMHTLYGASLTTPPGAFGTIEELDYGGQSRTLTRSLYSYYLFNKTFDGSFREISDAYLRDNGLDTLKGEIVMARLIPEYDMIQTSWKGVSNFAQTIAPMWKDLYVGVWANVENAIREAAFQRQSELTIFTGTHGQLAFNSNIPKTFTLSGALVPVPKFIWKLIIDELDSKTGNKKAIVLVLYNVSAKMAGANTFTQFQQPCEKRCQQLEWFNINFSNVFCCAVDEVKDIIKEIPPSVLSQSYDLMNKLSW